jgi:membrane associated rhomboid family serine protease
MIPIRDVIPARTTPGVVLTICAAIVALAVCERVIPDLAWDELLSRAALVTAAPSVTAWFTAIWFHYGLLDAASNLVALWIFGSTLEDRLGHLRFLLFGLLAAATGWAAAIWLRPDAWVPLVGAGGLVAGLIGGYVALFPRSRVLLLVPLPSIDIDLVEVPATLVAAVWLLLQVAGSVGPLEFTTVEGRGPNLWTQMGGLAFGALLVRLFRRPERARVEWWGA